ncbi:MAG: hypothetical protein HQM09_14280 [Candidatus Riflebacteria bacterium]|nr:hypothetical protein [Candidatus Riflebacteria bacterium]
MFERSVVENYRESIHGEGMFKKGLLVTATCNDCHTAHEILPHTATESTVNVKNIANTCFKCHGMIEQVHKKVIKGELWEKKPDSIPVCVDCHSAHQIRKSSLNAGVADQDCLKCHVTKTVDATVEQASSTNASMAATTEQASSTRTPIVVTADLASSTHAKINCVKCHADVSPDLKRPCETAKKVDCTICHVKQGEDYVVSIHGQLSAKKDPDAPVCTDCHGKHNIMPKLAEKSPIFRRNIPDLCGTCHLAGQKAARRIGAERGDLVQKYRMSTHGRGVIESGLISSAVCTDCHSSHREFPAKDERSSVNRKNVAATCAKCHMGINDMFVNSVHSPKVTKTDAKLPTCPDCHTSHDITRVEKPQFLLEVSHQCGSCHKDVSETYFQTYHGKAYQLGSLKAAKCSDCHGSHDILKPDNPDSHLSRNNVVATCKKCHQNANRQFVGYLTHATHHNAGKYPALFLTFWAMTMLLIGTFGFFGVHTLLWLPKSFARLKQKKEAHVDEEPKQYVRFALSERLLHLSVIVSFFGLAITGMMLKFANMAWASKLASLIGGPGNAGLVHRVCAVITFGYFVTHLSFLYQYKTRNNLTLFEMLFNKDSLVPQIHDIMEFFQTMRWFLGFGERPKYGRWTYWEKFDYFAVFWGITIIGSTGLLLWFPEVFTLILPGWLINVATIIHSDEALLAVGFIFTIHFFNTHLRPEAFPMDPVIFTGRIPLSELEHDRPREFEELKASGELEKKLTTPVSSLRLRVIFLFGLTCLCIGITLIVLIIYSMLFGYA